MSEANRDASHDGGTYGSATAAGGYQRSAGGRANDLQPITERMLDLVGIAPGYRVLDVAAGTGEQTLMAARRVGSHGSVLAIDIADRMLAYLSEAARKEGLSNIQTQLMDARALDLKPEYFDAAICRLALMLVPERHKALAAIHRSLKLGARFAAVVLSTAERLPHIGEPLAIARRHAGLAPAPFEDPGMCALGDPAVLHATIERAGFREVTVEIMASTRQFSSLATTMEHIRNSIPEMKPFLEQMSEASREEVWKEIETAMRRFEQGDGMTIPTERLVAVGRK